MMGLLSIPRVGDPVVSKVGFQRVLTCAELVPTVYSQNGTYLQSLMMMMIVVSIHQSRVMKVT